MNLTDLNQEELDALTRTVAEITARGGHTTAEQLLNENGGGEDKFFISDYTPYFEKIARMFFEGEINLKKADIWC